MAGADAMPVYVQKLLELDSARSRQLDWESQALQQAMPLPPPQTVMSHLDIVSQNLHQATAMLQSALVNWESCVRNIEAKNQVNAMTAEVPPYPYYGLEKLPMKLPEPMPLPRERAPTWKQAPYEASVRQQQHTQNLEAAKLVEMALSDQSMAPDAASQVRMLQALEAQGLLTAIAGGAPHAPCPSTVPKQSDPNAMKWLAQYLEQQQQVSVQKLAAILQAPETQKPMAPSAAKAHQVEDGWAARFGLPLTDMRLAPEHCNPVTPPLGQWSQAQQDRKKRIPTMVAPAKGTWTRGADGPRGYDNAYRHHAGHIGGEPKEAGHGHGETLRAHLRSLIKVECSRVLIVRKINRLGFGSPLLLKKYYGWYGNVERVLVAHSLVKVGPGSSASTCSRLRPSGLGFIVMSKTEEAQAILADGPLQMVCGAEIRVQQFERRMAEFDGDETEEITQDTKSSSSSNSCGAGESTTCYGDTNSDEQETQSA
eukprot:CAMPEP_0195154880 /NCGR_PEP_ID=MMETSP0448-20130528/183877_1 /TAXON_ID=66468 /ORGANISM="Heterocapsa triquestra, Strain CCMP 448" /LENGTH=481 /DNA_ID=CAMNT_0040193661 /DNA_START=127 /DNA_END=1572 /DNA_ORIENTATION=+